MTVGPDTLAPGAQLGGAETAGRLLAQARERSGLTLAAVAQQLKLAPRQIKALEDDDFAHLPERTFVRGFARNYARLLHLDPELVLASLPDGNNASAVEQPSLAGTSRAMGELPESQHMQRRGGRWAIPLALLAILAMTAAYELTRPPADPADSMAANPGIGSGTPALPTPAPATAPATGADPAATPLPNPLRADPRAQSSVAKPEMSTSATPTAPVALAPDSVDAPLVLTYRGTSWAEVKDRAGAVVLSAIGIDGATHSVRGSPPFEVWLANAGVVTITYRGQAIDLAPHTKQNIARLTLK